METEQRGTAYLGLLSADGSPATPDTKLEDLHHSSKTMLSNLPEYRALYISFELCRRVEILEQFVCKACDYFKRYGGLLSALQISEDPNDAVQKLWENLLWAIHTEVGYLMRIKTRAGICDNNYSIPNRPVIGPQPTPSMMKEHLKEVCKWIKDVEQLMMSNTFWIMYFSSRMESLKSAYLGAAHGSSSHNSPTLYNPAMCSGSISILEPPSFTELEDD